MKGGGWRGLARGSRWLVGWRADKQQAGGQASNDPAAREGDRY